MYRNVGGQSVTLLAVNISTGVQVNGDAANQSWYLSIDDGSYQALGSPTQDNSSFAPGEYSLALTAAQTNGNKLKFSGVSITANVIVIPTVIYTTPLNWSSVTLAQYVGTAQPINLTGTGTAALVNAIGVGGSSGASGTSSGVIPLIGSPAPSSGIIQGSGISTSATALTLRVLNYQGQPLTQSLTSSVSIVITDLTLQASGPQTSLAVSSVVYNSLQGPAQDATWTIDSIGYNFKYVVPASMLAFVPSYNYNGQVVPHVFRADVEFIDTSGNKWVQPFQFSAVPVFVI